MTAAIETVGLTKMFGATRGIEGLNLRVEPGEIFGFLGPNGAGKSTTIRALLDLHRPTAGTALVLGLDAHRDSVTIHRRIGYLPGDLALFGRMTARDHVTWFARARGLEGTGQADALAERFSLALDTRVKELSKGNRQKVGIVLAFMHAPELLILDEPTSGLDPLMKDEFEHLLRETTAHGDTVFLSSHELDEVQRVADRVGIIKEGRLLLTDSVAGLRKCAPQTIEVVFSSIVDAARFQLDGVRVVSVDGPRVIMEITGAIAPVLRIIADLDPVDLVSHRAELDELFLDFYRDDSERLGPDAN
ncbi:MAG TPA: ABC transporter ATP-binding protein [Acidimicrobiales bacterium]|nr:ABC transporter ATP-binding protein [Acidimicrobiales bacterium]